VTATDTQDQIFGYSSGLLDDFEGKIIEAYFAIDPAYFEAAVLLHLVMETNDADVPSVTEKYSVGKFWQIEGAGESVSREDGSDKLFNGSTKMMTREGRCGVRRRSRGHGRPWPDPA
jgi:hypothetical protein